MAAVCIIGRICSEELRNVTEVETDSEQAATVDSIFGLKTATRTSTAR
jgi:hypothetical protein